MNHHMSAVMLATLGSALLEVKTADERAAVIDRIAPLLRDGEADELRAMAGLPKNRERKS